MSAEPNSRIPPVVKIVTVEATPEEAFHYFTADIDKWWPLATHSCIAYASDHKERAATCSLEQRQGGRIVERGFAGEEHVWGTVLIWEPPSRLVFTWHPMREESTAQTVEVRFSRVPKGTRVVLTHSGWEKLRKNARKERESYNRGWESVFVVAYAEYVREKTKKQD